MIDPKIISSPDYDIGFLGVEHLHPFDTYKYTRAWNTLRSQYGEQIRRRTIKPQDEVSDADLCLVHTQDYLDSLRQSATIARALELMILSNAPYNMLRSRVIRPMRLATQGTILAAQHALESGIVVNLSGGYHHAAPMQGEGFCLFADVPVAIEKLRQSGMMASHQQAIIVDLDAHQGNGYQRAYHGKKGVFFFDMYNQMIFPNDDYAKSRIDYAVGLNVGCNSDSYLDLLFHKLPEALDRVDNPAIGFYVAGTDIITGDLLGGLNVSEEATLRRDTFVIETFVQRGIPLVIVLGGGYSKASYRLIADMVGYIIETYGDRVS
jgi:histone deacetylase 11